MLREGFFKDDDSPRQLLQTSFKSDVSNEEWLLIRALKLASYLLFDLLSRLIIFSIAAWNSMKKLGDTS